MQTQVTAEGEATQARNSRRMSSAYVWRTTPEAVRIAAENFEFRPHEEGHASVFFNVSLAKAIIKAKPRPVYLMDVQALYEWVDPESDNIQVDWNEAEEGVSYDLTFPCIVCHFEGADLLIDGWHRVSIARRSHIKDLRAVWLDADESAAIVMHENPVSYKDTSLDYEWHWESGESFELPGQSFSVSKAKEIIAVLSHRVVLCDITNLRAWVEAPRLVEIETGREAASMQAGARYHIEGGYIGLDWDRLTNAPERFELDVPIICAKLKAGYFPIDGWHRIARATRAGVTALPAVFLSASETEQVRRA